MRDTFLPFNRPTIEQEEIDEVVDTLRSGWLTTGPKTRRFQADFADYVGAGQAIAVNSCTAGLHLSLAALGVGPGDEVITSPLTFCSSVNVIVHVGATPVLADIGLDDFCIDPDDIRRRITPRTKAIIPVHYAGHPCKMSEILAIAREHRLSVIEDGAHAVGAKYRGERLGNLSQATVFSFYATKNLTTAEGGMITTSDAALAQRMQLLALHGMSSDAWKRYSAEGSWYYEIVEPGFKYNMTDIQASMGLQQLAKLEGFLTRRHEIARRFDRAFEGLLGVEIPPRRGDVKHPWHLYVLQLKLDCLKIDRAKFIAALTERKIGSSVHFIPIHYHPWYRDHYPYRKGDFPKAESVFERVVSLPLYPAMTDRDADDVIEAVNDIVRENTVAAISLSRP